MAPQLIENQRQTLSQLAGYVRFLNIVTALVQLTAGIATLIKLDSFVISKILIASYVLLFAALLLFYEGSFSDTDPFLRRNFGFLYSYQGLGLYLLFIGLLDLCLAGGFFGIVAGLVAVFTAVIIFLSGFFMRKSFVPEGSLTDSIHEAVDKLPSYGSIKQTGAKAGETVIEVAEEAKDKVVEVAGVAKDKAVEIGGAAKQEAAVVAEKTEQAAVAAKDATAAALQKGGQEVGEVVTEVTEVVGDLGSKISKTTRSVTKTISSKLSS